MQNVTMVDLARSVVAFHCKTTTTAHVPTETTYTTTQTARERAGALTSPSSCLDGGVTPGGSRSIPTVQPCRLRSGGYTRYSSPNVKPHGRVKSRMVTERQIHGLNPHHATVTR